VPQSGSAQSARLLSKSGSVSWCAAGGASHDFEGACLTSCINGMTIAGILLAVATCCGATEASAQLNAFVNVGGPGNAPAPGSAGLGTSGLGLGGFGSATESLGGPGLGDASIGSSPGLSLPLLNQGAGNALGVTGSAAGAAQGSLSSAIDRPSSPVDSVTNTLMGSVRNAVTRATDSARKPAGKRKQNDIVEATSSSSRDAAVASKVSPAKNPWTGSAPSP
jgi:hypothetical protein